ncbi:MAG: hypothetical protein ACU84J_11030 [Gammaproteobacteria bacterium]
MKPKRKIRGAVDTAFVLMMVSIGMDDAAAYRAGVNCGHYGAALENAECFAPELHDRMLSVEKGLYNTIKTTASRDNESEALGGRFRDIFDVTAQKPDIWLSRGKRFDKHNENFSDPCEDNRGVFETTRSSDSSKKQEKSRLGSRGTRQVSAD